MDQFSLTNPDNENLRKPQKKRLNPSKRKTQFDWSDGLPTLQHHSKEKLNILSDYVEKYVERLCLGVPHGASTFRMTIIDGFCGGGVYIGSEEGSPLILLKAIQIAEARINSSDRRIRLHIDAHFYFVDESKPAIESLEAQLKTKGFGDRIGKTVFLLQGKFEDIFEELATKVGSRYVKGGRIIYFLDQCGYCRVTPKMIRRISEISNNRSEYVINIAFDWFNDFVTDNSAFRLNYTRICEGSLEDFNKLLAFKGDGLIDWRFIIEKELGQQFVKASKCPFWSPFYIQSGDSHRGYWLLHLATKMEARLVMSDVHWKHGNAMRHYGGIGLDMLAYKGANFTEGHLLGLDFGSLTREQSLFKLAEDIPRKIYDKYKSGIALSEFISDQCNHTIANPSLWIEAISKVAENAGLIITGPKGGAKRVLEPKMTDIIRPNPQPFFPQIQWFKQVL